MYPYNKAKKKKNEKLITYRKNLSQSVRLAVAIGEIDYFSFFGTPTYKIWHFKLSYLSQLLFIFP